MRKQIIRIGEICELKYGSSLPELLRLNGEVPVYGSNGIVGFHDKAVTKGPSLIVGRKGSAGKVQYSDVPCFPIDTTYYIERTLKECNLKWLFYCLSFNNLSRFNKAAAVPGINRNDVYELEVAFPNLSEQNTIAEVLEQADKARQQRKAANALTEQFLQSSFLWLFGDPVKNEKGWERRKLIDTVTMRGGGTPDTKNDEYFSGDIPWVSPKDMKSRFITTSIDKITKKAIKESSTKLIEPESVLMVVRSGILKNTLPIGINIVPVAINQDMKAFACKPFLNPYFLAFQFEITASHILQSVRGTTADNISSDVLKNINLIVPPLSLQQQFASIVADAEQLRQKQRESERELEQLFQSLLQKFFD